MNTSPITGIAQATTRLTSIPNGANALDPEVLGAATAAVAAFVASLDDVREGTTRETQQTRIDSEINAREIGLADAEVALDALHALDGLDDLAGDILEGALYFQMSVDRLAHRRLVDLRAIFDSMANA